jgi:CRP-like cAMP-binding protein
MVDLIARSLLYPSASHSFLSHTYLHTPSHSMVTYSPHGRVLWLPFKWNALFIALNSYRIGRVLWHRYQAHQLPDELLKLRENYLFLMDPVDYYKLIRLGKVETVPRGSVMATQGQRSPHVRLLLSGECKVLRDGKLNYLLEEANFVAESGIHAGLLIPGSVESCCTIVVAGDADARFVVWDRTALVDLLNHDASVRRSLQAAISWDVVRKLKFQRSLLADGWIDDDPEAWTQRRTAQTQHRYTAILQNMLRYPRLLQARKPQLEIYRMIHHIDDAMHAQALQSCGWTVQEYEAGHRDRDDAADQDWHDVDHDSDVQDVVTHRDWKWYLYDIYYRFFG